MYVFNNNNNDTNVMDYVEQWRMFAVGGGAARACSAEMRMKAMLEQDMTRRNK